MKTNLNRTISTVEEAKNFLQELESNGESFHPEDDANSIEWSIEDIPTPGECTQLNALMEACNSFKGFDPCEFLLDLDAVEYEIKITGSGTKREIIKSLQSIIEGVKSEDNMKGECNTLIVEFTELWG